MVTSGANEQTTSSGVRSYLMRICVASAKTTSPSPSATIWMRLSEIMSFSMPVPTIGASHVTSGTAWRIMFDPISARLASSCSKKGIRLAAIEAI